MRLKQLWLFVEAFYIYYSFKCIFSFLTDLSPSVNGPIFQFFSGLNLIYEATSYLRLPVWSRNYKSCTSHKSEINCSQLILAYKTIKEWNDAVESLPPYAAIHINPKAGTGNGLYHIVSGIVVAISLNRSAQITKAIDGIEYNPLLNRRQKFNCNKIGHWRIQRQEYWQKNTYETLKVAKVHFTATYCFPYFILTEPGFSNFIYQHFGIHFVYFFANFVIQFSPKVSDYVSGLIESIPLSVKIIGVHIRTHKNKQKNYIYSDKKVKDVIIPFLNQILENKNYVAIATDWSIYIDLFKNVFPKNLIMADVQRKPDGDKFGASIDVRLLMSCNKIIGSYRSTFSAITGMSSMNKIYYVAMEYPKIFQFTNSQAGIVSGIYEDVSDFSYFVNARLKLLPSLEPGLRTFYRNLVY